MVNKKKTLLTKHNILCFCILGIIQLSNVRSFKQRIGLDIGQDDERRRRNSLNEPVSRKSILSDIDYNYDNGDGKIEEDVTRDIVIPRSFTTMDLRHRDNLRGISREI